MTRRYVVGWVVALALCASAVQAEVVEEIVAWVDGDIITKSDLEQEEAVLISELYRRFTGDELDAEVAAAKAKLLGNLIDRKILMHRASRMYDFDRMGSELVDRFKEANQIESDEELTRLLAQEGMSLEDLERRLIENTAPGEIIRLEVDNRISVSEAEIDQFYQENQEKFRIPAEFTLREIVLLVDDGDRSAELERAREIRNAAVESGADFETLARQYSEAGTRDDGGLLGPVGEGDLNPALEQIALDISVGSVSEVLEMPYGFHIIRVESRQDAKQRTLDDVREEVREYLREEKFYSQLQTFLAKARGEAEVYVADKYRDRYNP